jgi:hypothetical protein
MPLTGEGQPNILLHQVDTPMGQYVNEHDLGSRIYVPLTHNQLDEFSAGCTVEQMLELIDSGIPAERVSEKEAAIGTLKLIAVSGFRKARRRIPVLYDADDDVFYAALPGSSSGEEMKRVNFRKMIDETEKRNHE